MNKVPNYIVIGIPLDAPNDAIQELIRLCGPKAAYIQRTAVFYEGSGIAVTCATEELSEKQFNPGEYLVYHEETTILRKFFYLPKFTTELLTGKDFI